MLDWAGLLNDVRRKDRHDTAETSGTGAKRTGLERDFDRILFAAPTRRLADKTQVFPMEKNDSIRTRLTHSHEVANLARSIGVRLAFEHAEEIFGGAHEELNVKRNVPALLAAVGLAHDLGNPPFGHQGEIAIQQWFNKQHAQTNDVPPDFLQFDGNAQTFRLLTRLQVLNDQFGLNLTYATLAALVKYPTKFGAPHKAGYKKHGIFQSESEIIDDVWEQTGLQAGIRHPFAYVMEACDDIAYSIIDAEDTVKKGYASFNDLVDFLESAAGNDRTVTEVLDFAKKKNYDYKKENLSSSELNEVSMQMFRVKAIAEMVESATEEFVAKVPAILSGNIESGFELIKSSRSSVLCKQTKKFDVRYGFQHPEVLKLELEGNNYIKRFMDMAWASISSDDRETRPWERFVYGKLSENYRRVYEAGARDQFGKYQLLADVVSGMTESYLVEKHDEFRILTDAVY